jgi:hypothetical protein
LYERSDAKTVGIILSRRTVDGFNFRKKEIKVMDKTKIVKRGRPRKEKTQSTVSIDSINFSKVVKLNNLNIDPKMMSTMTTNCCY